MQIRILGPIEAEPAGGRRAPLPRGRTLAFLALLLVHRGAAVHDDRIVDELWPERGPQHARGAIQVLASRLRAALGDGVVERAGGGYALRLAPGGLDADRFEQGAARGREELAGGDAAAAAATLRDALELWRGAALADVAGERFAQPEIARLEELRLACLGDRLEAELACGRHAAVAAELDALVRAHPLDERLRGLQMAALYHAGRQADALAAYRAARRALVEGLGVEPSPKLRALEAAILRHDLPAPRPPPGRPAAPRPAARRWVTCVFAQLAPADGTAAPDPEALRAALEPFHAAAQRLCAQHGGRLVELRGDAVVAVFGIPAAREDDAQRAVHAAAGLVAAPLPSGLGVRCGACSGEVVSAAGDAHVVGEAMAAAERLGRAAARGEVRLAEATWRTIGHGARAERLPDGSRRLESIDADAPAIRRRLDQPLVGRERELEVLSAAFARIASARAPEILTVLGEAGIGKSRLVAELAGVPGTVLTGHCPARGEGVTLWPLREALLQARGARSWAQLATDLAIPPAAVLRAAAAVGLEEAEAGGSAAWAFRHLLGALARTQPLVLVVDDAHRAEPALLDLLEAVLRGLGDAPILLVWVARADEPGRRPASGEELVVPALSAEASRALVTAMTGAALAAGEDRRIVAAAGGNPLFLEQLVAYVEEQGSPDTLPPALHALLAARLDGLEAAERATLALAAIVGDRFTPDAVAPLATGVSRAEVGRACVRLAERGLVTDAEPDGLRFRHALIRDAAYAALAKSERARLHALHAGWLAGQPGLPDADARIGLHLEAAAEYARELGADTGPGLAARAGRHLAAAAGAAHRRGDLSAEIGFLERAIALLGSDTPDGAPLLPDLVSARLEGGEPEAAEALAERAVAVSARLGLGHAHARAVIELQRILLCCHPETFDGHRAATVAAPAAATLRAAGDERGLASAVHLLAELTWLAGDPVASYGHAVEMFAVGGRAGSDFDAALGLMFSAWALVEGPWPAPAALERLDDLARATADGPMTALVAAGSRAVLVAMTGRRAAAQADLARSRAGLRELGAERLPYYLAMLDAVTEALAGDAAATARAVADARALSSGPVDRWQEATVNAEAAVAAVAQGCDAAAAVARIDAMPAPCDHEWVVKRHRARAGLALQGGDTETAVAEARAAVAAAATGAMTLVTIGALDTLATALREAGDADGAAAAAARAGVLRDAKAGVT